MVDVDLKSKWESVIELYLIERSWAKVARKLKITPSLISRWRQSPIFQEMLDTSHKQVMSEIRKSTSSVYDNAIKRLDELIFNEDNKVSLRALEILIGHVERNRDYELEVKASETLENIKNELKK